MTVLRLAPLAALVLLAAAPASAQRTPMSVTAGVGVGTNGPVLRVGLERGDAAAALLRLVGSSSGEGDVEETAMELSANLRVRLLRAGPLDVAASAGLGLGLASEYEDGDFIGSLAAGTLLPVEAEASLRLAERLRVVATGHRAFPIGVTGGAEDLPLEQWTATLGLRLSTR